MAIGTDLWIAQTFGTVTGTDGDKKVVFDKADGIFAGINNITGSSCQFGSAEYGIYQLGVQTLPGVQLRLGSNSNDPIRVGQTGIFELNLNEKLPLDIVQISNLDLLTEDTGDNNNYILIDVIYFKKAEGGVQE